MTDVQPGGLPANWYADPLGRAAQRYWNGVAWTPYVIDVSGVQRTEPSAEAGSGSIHAAERSIVIQNVVNAPQSGLTLGGLSHGPEKSMAMAVILAVLFGPLGLFYASVTGAVILVVATVVTLGAGILITYPAAIIWAIVAVNKHNDEVMTRRSLQWNHGAASSHRTVVRPRATLSLDAPPPPPSAPQPPPAPLP